MNIDSSVKSGPSEGLRLLTLLAQLRGLPPFPVERVELPDTPGDEACTLVLLQALADQAGWSTSVLTGFDALREAAPCIADLDGAGWVIVARVGDRRVLLQGASDATPRLVSLDEFRRGSGGRGLAVNAPASPSGRRFGLHWIVDAARPHRRLLAEVLVASAVVQVLALLTPLFFQVVVDKVLVHQVRSTLQVVIVGLVLVSVFEVVLSGLRSWLLQHTANRMDVALGASVFDKLMRLPLAWFEARRVGDVVARVRELDSLRAFVTSSALTLVIDLAFAVIVFAVMYVYSPLLTGVVALSLPAYLVLSLVSAGLLREQVDQRFRCGAANQSFLVESVSGMSTVKAMALEPAMQRRWEQQLAEYVSSSFRVVNTSLLASQGAQLVQRLTTAAVLWFGAGMVIGAQLSVGELIAFNLFAGRISAPMLRLFQLWQDFQQARVSIARLGDVMNTPTERAGSRLMPRELAGEIRFENVRFRYAPDHAPALDDLSLSIQPGEVIGVVGASGSGKSTLARLLQRLSMPESGRVLVDGMDLRMVDPQWLRARIGVVPQETFLFNASVRDNIAPGATGLPMERVIVAAKTAGAHEFISALPDGYDTVLGEHAHLLSGGQRQRLAIARALIRNPRILLFDEATSALDVESEQVVRNNLRQICKGRTVIMIAHRLSSLAHVDRIVVMDRGRVVEQGTPGALLAQGGAYARMAAVQDAWRVAA